MNHSAKSNNCATRVASLLGLLLAGGALGPLVAQGSEYSPGYIYDMRGMVARDAEGNCRRTSAWTPSNAIEVCDPGVVAERAQEQPIRPAKARVTGVSAQVDVTALLAGEAFEFNSAKLSEAGKQLLAGAVGSHADDYIHRINVEGYTDKIGSPDYNLQLSQQRADAVKAELDDASRRSPRAQRDPAVLFLVLLGFLFDWRAICQRPYGLPLAAAALAAATGRASELEAFINQ